MVDQTQVCAGLLDCIYEFQVLGTGVLAIIAAVVTAVAITSAAQAPVEASEKREEGLRQRRLRHTCMSLSHELLSLRNRAVAVARKVRFERPALHQPPQIDEVNALFLPPSFASWEDMSLLPDETAQACFALARRIQAHNFDVSDGLASREVRQQRLSQIEEQALRLAAELSLLADDQITLRHTENIYAHMEGLTDTPAEAGKESQ